MIPYDDQFFDQLTIETRPSAEAIVPKLIELVHPSSVVDVGCATGTWMLLFLEHGVKDALGIDGTWLNPEKLLIPRELFRHADLEKPLAIGRRFDLAVSFEVAEHLSPAAAETFVQSLASLADVVAFSAAIPYQGGETHLNEQWPEYWAELFAKRGYAAVDALRTRLWNDTSVHYWYRQNIMLYVNDAGFAKNPNLATYRLQGPRSVLPLVHPVLYTPQAAFFRHMGVADATRLWVRVFRRWVRKNWNRLLGRPVPRLPVPLPSRAMSTVTNGPLGLREPKV